MLSNVALTILNLASDSDIVNYSQSMKKSMIKNRYSTLTSQAIYIFCYHVCLITGIFFSALFAETF